MIFLIMWLILHKSTFSAILPHTNNRVRLHINLDVNSLAGRSVAETRENEALVNSSGRVGLSCVH